MSSHDAIDLSHISASGEAHMVDVSAKAETSRKAQAHGKVIMSLETLNIALAGNAKKGDVFGVARIAGVMAAKKTSDLIPEQKRLFALYDLQYLRLDTAMPALRCNAYLS